MDDFPAICLLSLAMLVACYVAGIIPLAVNFSEVSGGSRGAERGAGSWARRFPQCLAAAPRACCPRLCGGAARPCCPAPLFMWLVSACTAAAGSPWLFWDRWQLREHGSA